jgi:hypothetical protein
MVPTLKIVHEKFAPAPSVTAQPEGHQISPADAPSSSVILTPAVTVTAPPILKTYIQAPVRVISEVIVTAHQIQ